MDLWLPDPDPQIAVVEGRFSDALANYLYRVHAGAHLALGLPGVAKGDVQRAYRTATLAKAEGQGVNRAARLFAELLAQPRAARKADDLAELLSREWFERGLIRDEAERAVVQANARGRIEAARGAPAPVLPASARDAALVYGVERAAIHVTRVRDTTRAVLAGAVVDALARGDSAQRLASDLTQRFGTLNRDARRLAITEIAFARANGFLAAVPEGSAVEWFTASGCCPACGRLNGRRFRVTRGPGDPETEVWPGKHNVGLPAAQRTPSIPYHPNCRCKWVRILPAVPAGVSARTLAALAALEG